MSDGPHQHESADDPTGRKRLTWNVTVAWGSQLITIALGFIMPRLVDEQLGQASLGIWDFAWAVTSYITLVNFGVGSNAARYVAQFVIDRDVDRLCRIVSSAHCIQVLISIAVLLATIIVVSSLDIWLPASMSQAASEAAPVILLLGAALTTEMLFDAWRGVLTGVHRWDVHNGINTLHHVLSSAGMVIALLGGTGLTGMAAVYCASAIFSELMRWRAARRYCPEARIRPDLVNREDVRLVSIFGLKNVLAMAGPLIVQQTVSVLITLRLGPALLAVFARPAALVRHMETFIYKFAFVLMPMAGSVQAQGDPRELRTFAVNMSEVGWMLAVPGGVFLMLFGPGLISLWMGEAYVSEPAIMALACGGMLATANRPAYRILFGLDRHGFASIASIFIYGGVLAIGIPLMMHGDAGLLTAAMIYVAGDVLFSLVLVPQQLARAIDTSLPDLLWQSAKRPIAVGVVSGSCLLGIRQFGTDDPLITTAVAACVHGFVTVSLYWVWVLPQTLKRKILDMLPGLRKRGGRNVTQRPAEGGAQSASDPSHRSAGNRLLHPDPPRK